MRLGSRNILVAVAGLAVLSILVSACASDATEAPSTEEAEHMDEDMDMEEMDHGVPEDAAAVPNPIAADDDSVALRG